MFHCFLPTLEKTGFPFKVNSDFSTDPSRKHLTYDKETEKSLISIATLIYDLVINAVYENINLVPIISLILKKTAFNKFTMKITNELKHLLEDNNWLILSTGEIISPVNYKRPPSWLEKSELAIIRNNSLYMTKFSLPTKVYKDIPEIDSFLEKYTQSEYSDNDWIRIISDANFIKKVNLQLSGKIFEKIVKGSRLNKILSSIDTNLETICFPVNGRVEVLCNLNNIKDIKLDSDFKEGFMQLASISDIEWFDNEFGTNLSASFRQNTVVNKQELIKNPKIKKYISRWRAAEQQCLEIEETFGYKAVDVSKQNLGYDIESKTPEGNMRYIEIKSVSNSTNEFTMTNNEYTAAHQYKENYYICIIRQNEEGIDATYIQDPINTLKLEKRVRQWEWYCDSYSGENFSMNYR